MQVLGEINSDSGFANSGLIGNYRLNQGNDCGISVN
jgi:hypothetical protein